MAKKKLSAIFGIALLFMLSSCDNNEDSPGDHPPPAPNKVIPINFTGPTTTINLSDLYNNDIYLVKVNTSGSITGAGNTGSVLNVIPDLSIKYDEMLSYKSNAFSIHDNGFSAMGHPAATKFNANPPPVSIVDKAPLRICLVS